MAIGSQIQPDRRGVAKLPGLREPFNARNEFREPVEACGGCGGNFALEKSPKLSQLITAFLHVFFDDIIESI